MRVDKLWGVKTDGSALEEFVVENDDLERLESLISQFNIFEAIGAVRRELRHSDVLAFLLDPNEAHGLGDHFLRRLLQRSLAGAAPDPARITPVKLAVTDLSDADVRREWRNIDVLVIDERNHVGVIVENKIDTTEHSEQLERYWDVVRATHPDFGLIALYLTPDGDLPSDPRYVAIDYALIANLIDEIITSRTGAMGPDVRVLLRHYTQLLRRHIVSDSEIVQLCRKIYSKHRRAIDLIIEHRPDRQQRFREELEQIIKATPGLVLDDCSKKRIRFLPNEWAIAPLQQATEWTSSKSIILFEFHNDPKRLSLKLTVGPGPTETRERCLAIAMANPKLFGKAGSKISEKWPKLYGLDILSEKYLDSEPDDVSGSIHSRWSHFRNNILPEMTKVFAAFPASETVDG